MSAKRHYRKKHILTAGIIVVVFVIGLGIWASITLPSNTAHYDNLEEVKHTTNLAVVLPGTLPRDAAVANHPVFEEKTGSIITRVTIDGKSVTLSQQKRPETDLKQIDTEDTFLVNAGSVYVLKGEAGRLQAIVETSDSWIMVNADAGLGISAFKALLESLDTI